VKTIGEQKANRYKNVWKWIRFNFIYTKIMLPNGEVYTKKRGIPSGSFLT